MKPKSCRFGRVLTISAILAIFFAGNVIANVRDPPASRAVSSGQPKVSSASALTAQREVAQMGRGINLLGYDPLWNQQPQTRFRLEQFADIKKAGFKTVRLNLMAISRMNAENELPEAWLDTLDQVIDAALAQGLIVIIDEHDHVDCRKNIKLCVPRLQAFWEQVSVRQKDRPPQVIFEIMNEPGGVMTPELWDHSWRDALKAIRQTNPTRNVIIGPPCSNSMECLDKLSLPEADRHIISSFHYYVPMEFTHQGAEWNPTLRNLRGVTWGSVEDKRLLSANFAKVKAWSVEHDRPILLGEFGAYEIADIESRACYTAAVAREAEKNGFAWTYWQFMMNFAVFDLKTQQWITPLRDALVPAKPSPASDRAGCARAQAG